MAHHADDRMATGSQAVGAQKEVPQPPGKNWREMLADERHLNTSQNSTTKNSDVDPVQSGCADASEWKAQSEQSRRWSDWSSIGAPSPSDNGVDPPANPPQEAAGSSDKPPKTAKEKLLSGGRSHDCVVCKNPTPHQELLAVPTINGKKAGICPTCEANERTSADPKLEYESTLATVKAERVTARFKKSRVRAGIWVEVIEEAKQRPGVPRKERKATMHDELKKRVKHGVRPQRQHCL